jgi:hypothetical protein
MARTGFVVVLWMVLGTVNRALCRKDTSVPRLSRGLLSKALICQVGYLLVLDCKLEVKLELLKSLGPD